MERKDYYFREIVTEGELDAAFDGAENADRNFALDNDFYQKADNTGVPLSTPDGADFNALLGGIVRGLQVTITGLVATITAGIAYDRQGRRIVVPATFNVDLSTTGITGIGEGGTPGGIGSISTAPASSQFKYILLQLCFNRLLSDPRTDGNNTTVYFERAESFQFKVKASNSSASPSIPGGDAECVILGAFKRNDSNTITVQDYSTRGDWIRTFAVYSTSPLPTAQREDGTTTDPNFISGTPRVALLKLRNTVNVAGTNYTNHINQSAPADKHAAKNIDFNATAAGWADAPSSAGLPTVLGGGTDSFGVQATINSIVSLLGSSTTGQGGTKKLGGAAHTGSPISLAAGTLRTQLQSLLDGINGHINAVTDAHPATAISVADITEVRSGTTVEDQLYDLEKFQKPAWPFGDGSDGDVTITGTTVATRDMFYHNLTINSGAILYMDGYVCHVQNHLLFVGTGTLRADSNAGYYGPPISPGVPGGGSKDNAYGTVSGGGTGGFGESAGGAAGESVTFSLGGAGGEGGRGSGPGNNGVVSSGLNVAQQPAIKLGYWTPGLIYARGLTLTGNNRKPDWFTIEGGAGGGGGAGTGNEGAGGAGGGVLIVIAANVDFSQNGNLLAKGHNGGNSLSAVANWAGGGGGGGTVILYCNNAGGPGGSAQTSAVCCAGGGPGTGSDPSGTQPTTGGVGTYKQYFIGYPS